MANDLKKTFSYHDQVNAFAVAREFVTNLDAFARDPRGKALKQRFARSAPKPGPPAGSKERSIVIVAGEFAVTDRQDIGGVFSSGFSSCVGTFWHHPQTGTIALGHHYEGLPEPEREAREIAEVLRQRGVQLAGVRVTLCGAWNQSPGYLPFKLFEELTQQGVQLQVEQFYLFQPGSKDMFIDRTGKIFISTRPV